MSIIINETSAWEWKIYFELFEDAQNFMHTLFPVVVHVSRLYRFIFLTDDADVHVRIFVLCFRISKYVCRTKQIRTVKLSIRSNEWSTLFSIPLTLSILPFTLFFLLSSIYKQSDFSVVFFCFCCMILVHLFHLVRLPILTAKNCSPFFPSIFCFK